MSKRKKTKMTPDEIIRLFKNVPEHGDFAPYEKAIRAAVRQREVMTPLLIAAVDRTASDPDYFLEHPEDCLHIFALYLLAQFRETRALDAFIHYFSMSSDLALELAGGTLVTEDGPAVLASVCGGDPAPLLRLAHDETVNEYVRGCAMEALAVQCIWGERSREAVLADLRGLFSSLPKPGDAGVWGFLVGLVGDFKAVELFPLVHQAYAEDLVEHSYIELEDIDPSVPRVRPDRAAPDPEEKYETLCEGNAPINAIAMCCDWWCFIEEYFDDGDDDSGDDGYGGDPDGWARSFADGFGRN